MMSFSREFIQKARDALNFKQAELLRQLTASRRANAELKEVGGGPIDEIDAAVSLAMLSFNFSVGNQTSQTLHLVRKALERIRAGSYGTCSGCGKAISGKRLAALPWAQFCLRCQNKAGAILETAPVGAEFDSIPA